MRRSLDAEMMDTPDLPEAMIEVFHRDLKLINSLLGNTRALIERLRRQPVRSVLDIGCGGGALLEEIRKQLGVSVTGVELRVPETKPDGIPIIAANAARDPLPEADVAVSSLVLHHLSETEVVDVIRNVSRSCRRFVCLDLVRHPVPMILFTAFICPLIHKPTALDGRQSIRRAYTPAELRALAERALAGTGATFDQWVSPIYARQILDITYAPV